ncbi:hypothetical protein [Nostoc sp.]
MSDFYFSTLGCANGYGSIEFSLSDVEGRSRDAHGTSTPRRK